MQKEIWKDIPEYEGLYQVSDLGRVKSLKCNRELILKPGLIPDGYLTVCLIKNKLRKTKTVHSLVALTFLNHKPCDYKFIIDHKDFIRTNNKLSNLKIVTSRKNTDKKHLTHSSIYTGVYWNNKQGKWNSRILIKRKIKHIGSFINEYDAHLSYQNELNKLK